MPSQAHRTKPRRQHPGSSEKEIIDEPDWRNALSHRVGYRDRDDRRPGLTNDGDVWDNDQRQFLEQAKREADELRRELEEGDLVTVRDVMTKQEDYHLKLPEDHPKGWRYVLHTTEDFIKHQQEWHVNVKKRQQQESEQKEMNGAEDDKSEQGKEPQKEHEWRRGRGEHHTHNNAYHGVESTEEPNKDSTQEDGEQSSKHPFTPQELAFLQALQHEKHYINTLQQNDGERLSPMRNEEQDDAIDEADQFTPDNWIPRSSKLIRLTGKHPFNAEPDLNDLHQAGLITPNQLHYVRNHGAVPHLLWETHTLNVEKGKLVLSMDELQTRFSSINIPVALACDGNRRKELNMIRRTKGYNWGPGAIGCAYWKGPLLRDILIAAGVSESDRNNGRTRRWVHFEGSDVLSEGRYATCIPLDYAMQPESDVILAYEMNNTRLPPDHGYPVRVIIPGYVGGRCVKWLARIWVSNEESDNYYHIYDNRVLPSFITDKDSEFAHLMFTHPSTACNEQNLNSVIVRPAHGETICLRHMKRGKSYRIEGLAYDGGGHEVQRVEVSLDGGRNWLYCIRRFPDWPIRHGNRFWTWLHWHVDVDVSHLIRADSIIVRCFNVFKNTQPEQPSWNLMGMMNNCWYIVRPKIQEDPKQDCTKLIFCHPCEPGSGKGGWLLPSTQNQMETIKHELTGPQKQFTREEIEKHNNEDDCWIVMDGRVYDATSVLSWHPGGKAPILAHAGKVHADTTDEFKSIHDDYAEQKLSECVLGNLTEKAKNWVDRNAEQSAKAKSTSTQNDVETVLERHRWHRVRLLHKQEVSRDTRRYTFALPAGKKSLGLATGQHIQIGFHFSDRLIVRPYTPTRPVTESEEDGTFDLVVKTYFPDKSQPGGTMSNILDCLRIGEEVEVKGPSGEIKYAGHGKFRIGDKEFEFDNLTLILGGSGITPGYQLISRILASHKTGEDVDKTKLKVIDANNTEGDILLRPELDQLTKEHPDQLQLTHVIAEPSPDWNGAKGFVTKEILRQASFEPGERNAMLLCGPPAMIQKAVLPALKEWGYLEDVNMFGF